MNHIIGWFQISGYFWTFKKPVPYAVDIGVVVILS
jgi:hypothetical protein